MSDPMVLRVAATFAKIAGSPNWTERGGKWLARVEYAGDTGRNEWQIDKTGEKFARSVTCSKGTFKHKKSFDSLERAQRYADRFIERANGWELLAGVLDRDFTKQP